MGLYLGKIYWCGSDNNEKIREDLLDLSNNIGVTFYEGPLTYDKKHKNSFSVEIGGFWIAWYGETKCRQMINEFLTEASTYLNKNDIYDVETELEHLPM